MSIFLLNRSPEPAELNVPVDEEVFLEVVDDSGADINLNVTQVYLASEGGSEVLAFDAGTFQPGFNDTNSATSSVATGIRRINIDVFAKFNSQETITIRVISANNAATPEFFDETYTFVIEDLTAPIVTEAAARELTVVRVTFDEAVLQVSAANSDDSLNPSNYTFARQEAPSVSVVAESVVAVSASIVDVTTDIPLSPAKLYKLTVANVADLKGNAVAAPFDFVVFTSFEPVEPADRSFVLYEMLPLVNRQEDISEDLSKFVSCLQEVTDLLLADIDGFPDITDPDTAAEQYVDAMLFDLGNPFNFVASLSLVDKRRLIRVLLDIYKQKGTCIGIQNVIRFFLGVEVECDEYIDDDVWILGEGELGGVSGLPVPAPAEDEPGECTLGPSTQFLLYAFTLVVQEVLTATQTELITEIVEYMKPAHTHFMGIVEPTQPATIDHLELGMSELGVDWELH